MTVAEEAARSVAISWALLPQSSVRPRSFTLGRADATRIWSAEAT